MSQEFYAALSMMHESNARTFAANKGGVNRHVECRITDEIYVYFMEDDDHIQTQTLPIPERWWGKWPNQRTIRRYIRGYVDLGNVRITSLDS